MTAVRIYNSTRGTLLAHTVITADTFWTRLKGLLGRQDLPGGWCMIIKPCSSVHTFFMSFPIDILFIDGDYRVLEKVESMIPFRLSRIVRKACLVIELPAGTLSTTGTTAGDIIKFS